MLADARGNPGGTVIDTPAQAITAQLPHQIGVRRPRHGHPRPGGPRHHRRRSAGLRARSYRARGAAGHDLDQRVHLAPGPVGQPGGERELRVDSAAHHPRGHALARRPTRAGQDPAGVRGHCLRGNGRSHAVGRLLTGSAPDPACAGCDEQQRSRGCRRLSGHQALVAQRIEHLTTDQKVGGSSPSERAALSAGQGAGSSEPGSSSSSSGRILAASVIPAASLRRAA